MANLTWHPIKAAYSQKIIGAAAFEGDTLVVVTAFFEDKDADRDGNIALIERMNPFGMQGSAITACFAGLKSDPDLFMKDPNAVNQGWAKSFVALGAGLIADGAYMAYFNRSVGNITKLAAKGITRNPVKSYAIRKGMEKVVKTAYAEVTR